MWHRQNRVSGLVKKSDYNAKITEIEGKIPSIGGLATHATLTTAENKIPNISSSVKKTRLWHKNYWNWKETYWS